MFDDIINEIIENENRLLERMTKSRTEFIEKMKNEPHVRLALHRTNKLCLKDVKHRVLGSSNPNDSKIHFNSSKLIDHSDLY